MAAINCKLIKFLNVSVVVLILMQVCSSLGSEELEHEQEERSFLNFFGPRPLPGDAVSPVVCERFCRNRCLSGGFSGFLGVPGCNQFCDCAFYLGGFW